MVRCLVLSLLLSTPASAQDLVFAWPADSVAEVLEVREREGRVARLGYRIRLQRLGTGEFRLDSENLRVLEIDGRSAPELPPSALAMLARPSLRVLADGSAEVHDLDAYLESLVTSAVEAGPSEAELAQLRATLATPQLRDSIELKALDAWNIWVGNWLGLGGYAGARTEELLDTPFLGISARERYTLVNLGPLVERPDHLRVSLESRFEDPVAVAQALMTGLRSLSPSAEGERPEEESGLSVQREARGEAILEAATLRPLEVEFWVRTTVQGTDQDGERYERQYYRFTWNPGSPDSPDGN